MNQYQYYKNIFENKHFPLAFIDLDNLNANIDSIKQRAGLKSIRIATKSIRCVDIINRILNHPSKQFKGLMSYSASEAVFLANQGFDNILIGYPCWQKSDIIAICEQIKNKQQIIAMLDSPEHALHYNQIAKQQNVVMPVCIDIDMSSKFPGLHFGVFRSPITNIEKAKKLFDTLKNTQNLEVIGIMGYEAQIAGIGDNAKGNTLKNKIIQALKKKSITEIAQRRQEIVQLAANNGFKLQFVNGGGTGSLETTTTEPAVTELTVGSGFYSPTLFDNYNQFKHLPAAMFAIEIIRQPKKNIFTCNGGGYIASGAISNEKAPKPYLPEKATLIKNESAGEVQTPIYYKGKQKLQLGNPIFLRHSKAGELCEHFNELYLISKGTIINKTLTYRGMGKCFL